VTNEGQQDITLTAAAMQWTRSNGVDEMGPTADIDVSPAILTIKPGQSKTIKVHVRQPSRSASESMYRLVLSEVPTSSNHDDSGLRILHIKRIPIYVAPSKTVHKEDWKVEANSSGKIVVRLNNQGNVHCRVGAIKVLSDQDKNGRAVASLDANAVTFPNESVVFNLQSHQSFDPQKLTVEIVTEAGTQYIHANVNDSI